MISPSYFTLAIFLMAVITFSVRYVFFMNVVDVKLHPYFKQILVFTAPCVLTAMFVPIMFQDLLSQTSSFSVLQLLTSSYFWASVAAIVLSVILRNTLAVILISMAIFYGLRLFVFA